MSSQMEATTSFIDSLGLDDPRGLIHDVRDRFNDDQFFALSKYQLERELSVEYLMFWFDWTARCLRTDQHELVTDFDGDWTLYMEHGPESYKGSYFGNVFEDNARWAVGSILSRMDPPRNSSDVEEIAQALEFTVKVMEGRL